MNAIELIGINKTYRQSIGRKAVAAVQDLTLAVPVGEAFGFIGANGAGKSTTIKIIVGALRADSGRSSLFDRPVDDPASRRGVSFVPENPSLSELMTPFEIMAMAMSFHGVRVDNLRAHCLHWLERFRLAEVADRLTRGFSKGMLQRAVLAQALAVKPRLLILDEPLSGLDPIGRKEVVDVLEEYKAEGGTIFFTSHVLHDVERIADRFGLIHRGRMHSVQSPGDLLLSEPVVTVRTLGASGFPQARAEGLGRWAIEVPRHELWATLASLEQAGHTLVEVKPVMNLERHFLSVVEAG